MGNLLKMNCRVLFKARCNSRGVVETTGSNGGLISQVALLGIHQINDARL